MVQAYFLFQCAYDLNSKTKQIIYYTSEQFNGYTLLVRTKHLLIDFTCKQRKNTTVNQMLANASTDPFIFVNILGRITLLSSRGVFPYKRTGKGGGVLVGNY